MAKKGRGAQALQLAFLASLVGGVFGVMLLIFLTPVLARWALAFGPSHLFWLAIFGVTVIGSLESRSLAKGLLSGCIGMWLATIGFDDILGAQRFIFHPSLSGGINIIAALIGLFAIPQVLAMLAAGRRGHDVSVLQIQKSPIREAISEVGRRGRALVIGTITGSFIGLIPGVGGPNCRAGCLRPGPKDVAPGRQVRDGSLRRSHRRRVGQQCHGRTVPWFPC